MNNEILLYAMCLYIAFLGGYGPEKPGIKRIVFRSVTGLFWGISYAAIVKEFIPCPASFWVIVITFFAALCYLLFLYFQTKREQKSFEKEYGDYMRIPFEDDEDQD